jgi:hypothetical protein
MYDQVDRQVTANKISGNPLKYVGQTVDLKCVIQRVVNASSATAFCGPVEEPPIPADAPIDFTDPSAIYQYELRTFAREIAGAKLHSELRLSGPVSNFDSDQVVRILGTVQAPVTAIDDASSNTEAVLQIQYLIDNNSPSVLRGRFRSRDGCLRSLRARMNGVPRQAGTKDYTEVADRVIQLLEVVYDGWRNCDLNNGFAFIPLKELNTVAAGEQYPTGQQSPSPMPSRSKGDFADYQDFATHQANCMKYITAEYPWYAKTIKYDIAKINAGLVESLSICDENIHRKPIISYSDFMGWARKSVAM